MSDTRSTLALAAGMGAIAGMRSMAAPALLSRHLARGRKRGRGFASRLLTARHAPNVLAAAAAGEMVADKTPAVPDRTEPPALAGRIVMGALCGAALAGWRGGPRAASALVGGAAAAGSTFLAYTLRKEAGERTGVPDLVFALVEDALVFVAGSRLAEAV